MKITTVTAQGADNVIRLYKGEETAIIKESYSDREVSPFVRQYEKALSEIGSYLKRFEDEDSHSNQDSHVTEYSNVFAFIGDRGTGKTSCMQSVANMLNDYSREKGDRTKFLTLKVIDPTIFNDNTNILHLVIGILFQEFKSKISSHNPCFCRCGEDKFESNKNLLLKAFQGVKDCIKVINNPDVLKSLDDDISSLSEMASVSILREKMDSLVSHYLDFFESDVLVLQVDDIDLQTQYAYQMIEEIRKYFTLKKVIVLMSFKYDQLLKVIELENAKRFKTLVDLNQVTTSEIKDMANKYLLKLIPISHRINMPTAEIYANSLIEYYQDHRKGRKSLIGEGFPISIKYAITTLIYKKCRYLFYHSDGVISPIVPRNMRELRHLLAILVDMPDYYQNNMKFWPHQKSNKAIFLDYFYNNWVKYNISTEHVEIVENILNVRDAAIINKVVILQLKKVIHHSVLDENSQYIDVERGVLNDNSLAHVRSLLEFIKQNSGNYYDQMLVFFIETFYSFKLYEYYDELTAIVDSGQTIREKTMYKDDDWRDETIKSIEAFDGISNYELLVGGSFFTSRIFKFKSSTSLHQIIRRADIDTKCLNIAEVLALCILSTQYREHHNKIYGQGFVRASDMRDNDLTVEKVSLGAFFSNIVNVEGAYKRFNPRLFEYAKEDEHSLYNTMLKFCDNDRGGWCGNAEHAFLSYCAIRNFEVLNYLVIRTKEQVTDEQNLPNTVFIQNFFRRLSDCKIKTYDRNSNNADINKSGKEKGKPNTISFDFAKEIVNILESNDCEQILKEGLEEMK